MKNFDFETVTSKKVIDYLKRRNFELTQADRTFLRTTINEATSSAWEAGTHDNGCNCGQLSCPICTP